MEAHTQIGGPQVKAGIQALMQLRRSCHATLLLHLLLLALLLLLLLLLLLVLLQPGCWQRPAACGEAAMHPAALVIIITIIRQLLIISIIGATVLHRHRLQRARIGQLPGEQAAVGGELLGLHHLGLERQQLVVHGVWDGSGVCGGRLDTKVGLCFVAHEHDGGAVVHSGSFELVDVSVRGWWGVEVGTGVALAGEVESVAVSEVYRRKPQDMQSTGLHALGSMSLSFQHQHQVSRISTTWCALWLSARMSLCCEGATHASG